MWATFPVVFSVPAKSGHLCHLTCFTLSACTSFKSNIIVMSCTYVFIILAPTEKNIAPRGGKGHAISIRTEMQGQAGSQAARVSPP